MSIVDDKGYEGAKEPLCCSEDFSAELILLGRQIDKVNERLDDLAYELRQLSKEVRGYAKQAG